VAAFVAGARTHLLVSLDGGESFSPVLAELPEPDRPAAAASVPAAGSAATPPANTPRASLTIEPPPGAHRASTVRP
jgi:hypothetical protein